MKKFVVIGNPVDHSLSPVLHNWVFNTLGIRAEYNKICVENRDLPQIIQQVRDDVLCGMNVTIPFKEKIMKFLDEINPRAQSIGSVNCIMSKGGRVFGNNTDWYGFLQVLELNKIDVSEKEVIVLGAGGTAKSILFTLKQLGIKKILLLNRTIENAKKLESDIVIAYSTNQIESIIKYNSIIINTTPIGMQTNQSPIDFGLLNKNQLLIDTIYIPFETSFLKFGKKLGAKTLNGLDMFIYQGLASLDLWFGEDISKQVNFPQIKSYLQTYLC